MTKVMRAYTPIDFADVSVGEIFCFLDEYFIKVSPSKNKDDWEFNSIFLSTGVDYYFQPTTVVGTFEEVNIVVK